MAYAAVYLGHREEPDEFTSTRPIACTSAGCNAVMDEDDDDIAYSDGDPYCSDHIKEANQQGWRVATGAMLNEKLAEILTSLDDLSKEYTVPGEDIEDDPYPLIDDVAARISRAFAKGIDTGWRDGMMLSDDESNNLLWDYEKRITYLSIKIKVRWDMVTDKFYPQKANVHDMRDWGEELAHVANQLVLLRSLRARTRKGVGVSY